MGKTVELGLKRALSASEVSGNSLKTGDIDKTAKKQKQAVTSFVCKGLQPVSTADEISGVFQKDILADGEGFEPPVRFPVRRFSRPVP